VRSSEKSSTIRTLSVRKKVIDFPLIAPIPRGVREKIQEYY
jgi:hypothetical protein